MSSTASPTGTDWRRHAAALPVERVATVVAALMLTVVILSFRPFQPAGADLEGSEGDIVNQLGFGSLGALAVFSLMALADRRRVAILLSPWWLLLLGFLALSVLNTPDPATTARTAAFTVIGILTVATVLVLPRDAEAFSRVIAFAGLTIVGLCYAGLVLMPDVAIHGADSIEPQHAGFWRGAFTHKNIAGPVMAWLSFAGIYLWRRGRATSGLLLLVLAMIFLANTGSKTTAGTVPLAVLLVIVPGIFGMRLLIPFFLILGLVGMALATLGIVFIEPIGDFAAAVAPDLTYTGRTSLWAFLGEKIAENPWIGYGYDNFWGLGGVVLQSDQPFDRAWDIRGIVHGHNSYLDLAAAMGLPALAVAVVTFVFVPLRDYLRVPPLKENIYLADFFMMFVAFALMNAFLESFFFRRADPVWLFFVFALLGLRLTARFAIPASASR